MMIGGYGMEVKSKFIARKTFKKHANLNPIWWCTERQTACTGAEDDQPSQ
jgi:hypothetical protein